MTHGTDFERFRMVCDPCGFIILDTEWTEFKFTPGCPRCAEARRRLRRWVREPVTPKKTKVW